MKRKAGPLQDERARGKRIVATVAQEVSIEVGRAFSHRSLDRAILFGQGFTNLEVVATLSTQLSQRFRPAPTKSHPWCDKCGSRAGSRTPASALLEWSAPQP